MKEILHSLLMLVGSSVMTPVLTNVVATAESPKTVYDFNAKSITGEDISLGSYKGKVLLVVNIASQCGFTPQLGDLQKLYDEFNGRGFEILGFPSNDFGAQEPLANAEVKQFCKTKYGVTFPLFEKGSVSGKDKQPVYKFITEQSAKEFNGDPGWNFVKFIVNKEGIVVDRFSSMTNPLSSKVRKKIDQILAAP